MGQVRESMYRICHFTLYGDFVIHDVTTALSLTPSSTLQKGELIEVDGEPVTCHIATWDLYGPDELNMTQQVEFLVATLWKRAEEVRRLADRFTAYIVLVFTRDSRANTLMLKPEALQKLASLNITLDCAYVGEIEDDD